MTEDVPRVNNADCGSKRGGGLSAHPAVAEEKTQGQNEPSDRSETTPSLTPVSRLLSLSALLWIWTSDPRLLANARAVRTRK